MLRSFLLQRIVFFIISGKIKSFCLRRNSFARIILKLAAFFTALDHTPFGAQILILFQAGTVLAVFTAAGHFLSEQHRNYLTKCFLYYTTTFFRILLVFFVFRKIRNFIRLFCAKSLTFGGVSAIIYLIFLANNDILIINY